MPARDPGDPKSKHGAAARSKEAAAPSSPTPAKTKAKAKAKAKSKTKSLGRAERELSRLQRELTKSHTSLSKAHHEAREAEAARVVLAGELAEAKAALEETQAHIDAEERAHAATVSEGDTLRRRVAELEGELATAKAAALREGDTLRRRVAELEGELATAKAAALSLSEVKARVHGLEAALAEAEEVARRSAAAAASAEAVAAEARGALETLRQEHRDLLEEHRRRAEVEATVKALEERLAEVQRALDDELEAHRASCRRHSDELDAQREREAKGRQRRVGGALGAGLLGLLVLLRRRR